MTEAVNLPPLPGPRQKRAWFVATGPDSRHLIEFCGMFDKLRDATRVYEQRPDRAKELFSLDFSPWENGTNKRVIRQRVY